MKTKLFLIALSALLSGCYITVHEKSFFWNIDDEKKDEVLKICEAMNEHGDIRVLLAKIKQETKKVEKVLAQGDAQSNLPEIERLADSIHQKAMAVIELSKKEWVEEKYPYSMHWRIDSNDFQDLVGTKFENGFAIKSAHIRSIFFAGELRPDYSQYLQARLKDNIVVIDFKRTGSALELCQLNETLSTVLEVYYRNIKNYNNRFFRLSLRPVEEK